MELDEARLQAALGYQFREPALLRRALTHKSYAYEAGGPQSPLPDNEQLEFLGDAVLGLAVSELLVQLFPERNEGYLSKLKSRLVSARHLAWVARQIHLGEFLFLGKGEQLSGGREKQGLLADALEAVIGALYLDGGYAVARDFVSRVLMPPADELARTAAELEDYKGLLQEFVQARKLPAPEYRVLGASGPDHSKEFTVEVRVGEQWRAFGRGSSKKRASQQAAAALLKQLGGLPGSEPASEDSTGRDTPG